TRFSRDWSSDVCSSDLSNGKASGILSPALATCTKGYEIGSYKIIRPTFNIFESWHKNLCRSSAVIVFIFKARHTRRNTSPIIVKCNVPPHQSILVTQPLRE